MKQIFIYRVSLRDFPPENIHAPDDIDEVMEQIGKKILNPKGLTTSHILNITPLSAKET